MATFPDTTLPFAQRLAAAGLKLGEAEAAKLAALVADLDTAAARVRGERSYLLEPAIALDLTRR